MALPIPFLYFWEMESGKLEIADGSQRLRTLHECILKDLELVQPGLPSLTDRPRRKAGDPERSRRYVVSCKLAEWFGAWPPFVECGQDDNIANLRSLTEKVANDLQKVVAGFIGFIEDHEYIRQENRPRPRVPSAV
jgi:hypothetical protein